MRWRTVLVVLVAAIAAIAIFAAKRGARPSGGACPELAGLDPALAALDEAALKARLREGAIVPPSMIEAQIGAFGAQADKAGPDRRSCVGRSLLARAVADQDRARKTTPSLWGLGRPSGELERLFLTEPVTRRWTNEERRDVLAQLEATTIARLSGGGAADLEHWRRLWYGVLIGCELTDDALRRLDVRRPDDCPHLAPRRPAP